MTYGASVRMIRKQKGMTLKVLAKDICSLSFLSKFERGDSDISLFLMTKILDKLQMSFDEFLYIHNGYKNNSLEHFFNLVHEAFLNRDLKSLQTLKENQIAKWQELHVESFHHNVILIDVLESIVDHRYLSEHIKGHHVKRLTNHLFSVEIWGYYEFILYNVTMFLLEPSLVIQLSRIAYKQRKRYKDFSKIANLIHAILFNTITYLVRPVTKFKDEFLYKKEYQEFISYAEDTFHSGSHLEDYAYLQQIKAIYHIRTGDLDLGLEKVNDLINTLNKLGASKMAFSIKSYVELIT